MSASRLHNILGQGDDDTWKKLCEHSHSFLFASIDIDNQTQVTSLHELVWDKRKPTRTASGVTGWVRCRQNSRAGDPLAVSTASGCMSAGNGLAVPSTIHPSMETCHRPRDTER